jgi:hypothetical protein
MKVMEQVTNARTVDLDYKSLYKVGSVAALIAAVIFRRNLDAEWMLLRGAGLFHVGPATPPDTVLEWFALLQQYRVLGLTLLNFFDLVNYALVGLIFLALYAALRQVHRSLMTLAAVLSFLGIAIYFASNQAFSMLSLSNQYAAATIESQKAMYLAAGQAVLAIHNNNQGMGLYMSLLLVSIAGLIIASVMLRSKIFSRGTAYVGILANVFGLGYYLVLGIAPAWVFIPLSLSAPFLLIWYLLIGRQLWKISSQPAGSSKWVGAFHEKAFTQSF